VSKIAKVLFVLVVVPIGILVLFAVLNAVMGSDKNSSVTTTPTQPPATTQPNTTQPNTTPPDNSAPGQYVNDDYQVPAPDPNPPDLPAPQTWDDVDAYLLSNPLYQQSVGVPVRCDIDQVDLTKASKSQLQSHFDQLTACLMRVWAPTLSAAGYEAVRPTVTIYSGQVQSACGQMPDENALYCGADQQVYYASDLPDIIPSNLRSAPFVVDSVLAHEFGHAIQGRSGILISEQYVEQDDTQKGDTADADDASRRTEMQADCFAGEFLHSISQSTGLTSDDEQSIGQLFYSIGDDVLTGDPTIDGDHGWGKDRQSWLDAGLGNPSLETCDTFNADASTVR
jgi:predicted metalloprotease